MILFFGPPGSGKSVQGKLLVERNHWQWVSTGELFRNSKDPEVLEKMATGALIDDALTNRVLDDALKSIAAGTKVILDGYPRNLDQAEWLLGHLPDHDRAVNCVILFEVSRDELLSRLTGRGRTEDTPEIVAKRLDIYVEKTQPVVDYYRKHGVPVLTIDGEGNVEEIHERIQAAVMSCLQLA